MCFKITYINCNDEDEHVEKCKQLVTDYIKSIHVDLLANGTVQITKSDFLICYLITCVINGSDGKVKLEFEYKDDMISCTRINCKSQTWCDYLFTHFPNVSSLVTLRNSSKEYLEPHNIYHFIHSNLSLLKCLLMEDIVDGNSSVKSIIIKPYSSAIMKKYKMCIYLCHLFHDIKIYDNKMGSMIDELRILIEMLFGKMTFGILHYSTTVGTDNYPHEYYIYKCFA